jgi:lipopolysaccharide/colanic/teichoic acid biosynthesis glycosyltransferase
MKRIIEIVLSSMLLICLFPAMLFIVLVIKLDTRGPSIFKQERVGFHGKPFILYKFRTMFCYTDPLAISPAGPDDKRITRVGRFLRKYAVDEWPQFFNILKGDMSFVGPRPQLAIELQEFQPRDSYLLEKRLTVRPGLTCSWAISRETLKTRPSHEMLAEDCNYAESASLWGDVKILYRTFLYLFTRR